MRAICAWIFGDHPGGMAQVSWLIENVKGTIDQAIPGFFAMAHTACVKIRVAIIGFGFMGQMHARVYQALSDVEVVGVADSFEETSKNAQKLGLQTRVASSLQELLSSLDFDVADICLPTDLHADAIIAAARAGKHIFCEKPLALEIKDAERALQEVERSGVTFQVGQCIRFWPEYQALEQFVKSDKGGALISLSLQRRASSPSYSRENWLHQGKRSKGAALDLHIHDTDFVLHLLGKPKGVRSIGIGQNGNWSRIFTQYLFDSTTVVAEGAWDLPPKWGFQMAFQAVFENAVIDFDSSASPTLHLTLGDSPHAPMKFQKAAVAAAGETGGNISDLGGYYNELSYFCDCLRQRRQPVIATGRQALESLRTVLAEIASIESGQAVVL